MTPQRSPLLPDRYPQQDLFVCDIVDAAPKGDIASMEHPVFSLATKPDFKARKYQNGETFIKISPSPKGLATVHDRDVLICLLYTSPSPRDRTRSRMPSSA